MVQVELAASQLKWAAQASYETGTIWQDAARTAAHVGNASKQWGGKGKAGRSSGITQRSVRLWLAAAWARGVELYTRPALIVGCG